MSETSDKMESGGDTSVFVTRFALSDRTAIGVQTRHLVNHFPSWRHLYWHEKLFEPSQANSVRLENMLFSNIPFLKQDNALSRSLRRLGFSWWRENGLSNNLIRALSKTTANAKILYLAPIEAEDARRMRAIVQATSLPFVVHLWDFLDNKGDPDTEWLIANAVHVFCLNAAMVSVVRAKNVRTSSLTFLRDTPAVTSSYSASDELVVALIGEIGYYMEGVNALIKAVEHLRAQGVNCRILYVGSKRALRRENLSDLPFISATGFLRDPAERDLVLSKCQVGFLPGPAQSPDHDARSRFSIPSRILDFLSLGLPIVGTVHPASATYQMCDHLGLAADILDCNEIELADRLRSFTDPTAWRHKSEQSLAGFATLKAEYDVGTLLATMTAPRARRSRAGVERQPDPDPAVALSLGLS